MSNILLETFVKESLREEDESQVSKEEEPVTWGHLRSALNKEKRKKLSKAVLKDLISLIPYSQGLNTLSHFLNPEDFKSYIESSYGLNGKKVKDNIFKIDPDVSKLLDDKIENGFINFISKNLNNKELFPDDQEIKKSFNMTKLLQKYIHKTLTDKANVITRDTSKRSDSES